MKIVFTFLSILFVSCQSIISLPMVLVEGGTFVIGNTEFDIPERVTTVNTFYMSPYEVTIKEWTEFVNSKSLDFEWNNDYWGDILDHSESELAPVQYVQWWQAIIYCNWLSEKYGYEPVYIVYNKKEVTWNEKANGYRLPTEIEWEYAARGGNKSKGYIYSGSNDPFEVGWFKENAQDISRNVGTKKSNELGIYDMSGNISEWCWGSHYWEMNDFMKRKKINPLEQHIIKGGDARSLSDKVLIFYRGSFVYTGKGLVGLRVVRNAE